MRFLIPLLFTILVFGPEDTKIKKEPKAQEDPLEGVYSLLGTDSHGEYIGTAMVKKDDDRYIVLIQGLSEVGVYQTTAFGVLEGDILALAWENGKSCGLTVYKWDAKEKTLTGRWLTLRSQPHKEQLKRISNLPRGSV